ncbi:MAG: hypothetical protein WCH20_10700 [Nitrospira sp.]
MAHQTPVVGNLALADAWPRLSDTESVPTHHGNDGTIICSTAAAGSPKTVWGIYSAKPKVFISGHLEGQQLDIFNKWLELPATHIIRDVLVGETSLEVEASGIVDAGFFGNLRQTVATHFNAFLLDTNCILFSNENTRDEWEGPEVTKFGSLCLSDASKSWTPEERLETLRIQMRELFDEFLKWPGSYNQLLLSGSLDYCRSAINKLKNSPVDVQDKLISQIRSYYNQCYGLSKQYQQTKSTIRRLNLQSLQDRFELLQEACASVHVYPRLEDLDLADIPAE